MAGTKKGSKSSKKVKTLASRSVSPDKSKKIRGGASSGAGAGKVTFNPFSITRKVDKSSP